MAREIQLTQGAVTVVDDEDYEAAIRHTWHLAGGKRRPARYAITHYRIEGKQKDMGLHHLIAVRMNLPVTRKIDHRDRNGLNNRRDNLRPANDVQNGANASMRSNNTSGFMGVSVKRVPSGKLVAHAYVKTMDKQRHLGCFDSAEEAARVRDEWAWQIWGDFAYLNFPRDCGQPRSAAVHE